MGNVIGSGLISQNQSGETPLTGTFALPAGTDKRVLVFFANCSGEFGSSDDIGDPALWTLSYGGVTVPNVAGILASGTGSFNACGIALFILPVAGATFANPDVVFTPVGADASTTQMHVACYCVDGVLVLGDQAVYELVQARADSGDLALPALPVVDGGLVMSFFVTLSRSDLAVLAQDVGYTYQAPADWLFTGSISGGDFPGGRVAYNPNGVEGDLVLTWLANGADFNAAFGLAFAVPDTSFNCECDVDPGHLTLAEIRTKALTLSGYASQLASLPPGIREMYNGFADTAQKWVYAKLRAMETARFFTWTLEPGVRYYGIRDNTDDCAVELNRYRIIGAWIQDLNNTWWPLIYGIDPTFYTLDRNFGWPTHYEVRECIELFPAPQAAYKLYVKAHFDLLPFTDDEDVTTVPSEPVENYTIFLAKSHKGMPDARIYLQMAEDQIASLIAGAHASRRYIPGARQKPVPTPPTMVQFDD